MRYRNFNALWVSCVLVMAAALAGAQEAPSPWGIAGSASSGRDVADWLPVLARAGVTSLRLFPEWRGFEGAAENWNWAASDALVKAATDNHIELNAILMGSAPGTRGKAHAFPMDHLDAWSAYVNAAVGHYKGQVRCWEVWNEGNGGFNDNRNTSIDYARLAEAAYAGAKKANPAAQIGLSVASFDVPYLYQAIGTMRRDDKPNQFDFLCIHPYEIADGLADPDGEIPYLWMTRTMRSMLQAAAPEKESCPIWITEVGRRIGTNGGRAVTQEDAARSLVKLYTMALAQGIARVQWFEGRDPAGEEPGFGLLSRDGRPRLSYTAMKNLAAELGASPRYVGWLAPGPDHRAYGFVFEGLKGPVLVVWMPAGEKAALKWPRPVNVLDPLSGQEMQLGADQPIELSPRPLFIRVWDQIVAGAQLNRKAPFPWGGDYAQDKAVSALLGGPGGNQGVYQTSPAATPHCTFADGSTGLILRGDQSVSFYTHPSFSSFETHDFYIRITVRRLAPGNLGMNLFYQSAEGLGLRPYKNREQWYSVPREEGWHTHTWHITDASFTKMWGYDFSIRPEQSVPFVLGKVQVSKVPFQAP